MALLRPDYYSRCHHLGRLPGLSPCHQTWWHGKGIEVEGKIIYDYFKIQGSIGKQKVARGWYATSAFHDVDCCASHYDAS